MATAKTNTTKVKMNYKKIKQQDIIEFGEKYLTPKERKELKEACLIDGKEGKGKKIDNKKAARWLFNHKSNIIEWEDAPNRRRPADVMADW